MNKETPEVIIVVRGGVAEVLSKSDNVRVIIRDYDIEGTDGRRLITDPDGDECIESIYE